MESEHTQESVEAYRIIEMLRRVFEYIDPRLMRHGERVAFLTDKLYAAFPEQNAADRSTLLLLSLLHDLGAYKTEEIDDMMGFETQNIWPHAVYGYLFLRMTTRLREDAQAILYHHAPWKMIQSLDERRLRFASVIHLADRIDVLTQGDPDANLPALLHEAGGVFSPELVQMFLALNEEQHLTVRMASGDYIRDVEAALRTLAMQSDEIIEYLRMIVYAIDFRSPFTVTHTANTVAISRELGVLLDLSKDELDALELGAFLHDIGKIFIPVDILENPGKLSDEEMRLMRTHVVKTGEIIEGFIDDRVFHIAVRHHEKLNGSGYPLGLTGESLTLPERIIAVSDVVSALINRRSYKEAFPKERATGIIKEMRDAGELCPTVCDALLRNYDAVMQNVAVWVDPVVSQYETLIRSYADLSERAVTLV